ncbi:hypothetical protein GCM10017687_44700 [Streptomyces echinatus]
MTTVPTRALDIRFWYSSATWYEVVVLSSPKPGATEVARAGQVRQSRRAPDEEHTVPRDGPKHRQVLAGPHVYDHAIVITCTHKGTPR